MVRAIYRHTDKPIKVPRFAKENGFVADSARSKQMSKIRACETKQEVMLRKTLWSLGVRYRKNDKRLPGKPDIVIPKAKIAIFIDGEFWHGWNWSEKKERIKSNRGYWVPKIERNIQRDLEVNRSLEANGWTVLRFWERELAGAYGKCIREILLACEEKEIGLPFVG